MADASTGQKLSLRALTALVVSSMIGSGIFALPATFARSTATLGGHGLVSGEISI